MPISIENHPEFPESAETIVFNAWMALLRSDSDISGLFNIEDVESEDIRDMGNVTDRSIWGHILRVRQEDDGTGNEADLFVTIEIDFVYQYGEFSRTHQNMKWRIMAFVRKLVANNSPLQDALGNDLTEGVEVIDVTEAIGIKKSQAYFHVLTITFISRIDKLTQLPIGVSV